MMSKNKGMAGRSKTPPKGDVRPLGTKKTKTKPASKAPWAALPDAEPEARAMLDAAIDGTFSTGLSDEPPPPAPENTFAATEKPGCNAATPALQSQQQNAPDGALQQPPATPAFQPEGAQELSTMASITLKRSDKTRRSTNIVYTSDAIKGSVRFSKTAFAKGEPPAELTVEIADGVLAAPGSSRATMTPEERKAARAAQPKKTIAEQIAAAEKRAAALKAKLAKQAEAQPATAI